MAAAGSLHGDAALHAHGGVVIDRSHLGDGAGLCQQGGHRLDRGRIGGHLGSLTGLDHGILDAGERGLHALGGGEDVELGPLLGRQVLERHATEQVVHEGVGDADVGIVGHAGGLEAHAGERLDEAAQRHAVLEAVAHRDGEGVHDAGEGGTLLGHPHEDLAGATVLVLTDGDETLAVGDAELEGSRHAGAGELLADRLVDDALDDALDDLGGGTGGVVDTVDILLGGRQRLGHLAVVAVDGDGLDAELPGIDVELLDLVDRDLFRKVDGLGDGPGDERLHRAHHADVTRVMDGVVTHGAGEHRDVLGPDVRRTQDRHVLVDVGGDLLDLLGGVAEPGERTRNGLVDDGHRAAADQLLHLDETEVGLDAGGVAVHHEADGAGGSEHRGLGVAHTDVRGDVTGLGPGETGGHEQIGGHAVLLDAMGGGTMLLEHAQHVLGVLGVAGEGAHAGGGAGRGGIGMTGHERGDGRGQRTTLIGVVGKTEGHEQGADVGVAQPELTELVGVLTDRDGRVIGVADEDLLRGEHDLDGVAVGLDIEGVIGREVLEQVDAGEVAGRVVDVHVLGAGVRTVDATGVAGGVPVVDGGVELHAGVGALPCGLGDLTHEVAGLDGLDDGAVAHGTQVPIGVVDHGLHELVGDTHGVVGVLVLDGGDVGAVEIHVEAGVAQRTGLLLLTGLAPDELLDIGVIGVEDDHLGGAAGLATGLDRAGRRVGATHEAHRTGGGAAALEELLGGPDAGQVDAGAGAALEDRALLDVPVEDGVHLVVDGEDEAGGGLLRHAGHADVEPHRRVEGGPLGHDDELEFVAERLGLGGVDEVAVGDAPVGDGVGDAIGHLLERPLALGGAGGAAEVLLGHDVGGVERPADRELDAELLEGDLAGLPVRDAGVATLPLHHLVGVGPLGGEVTTDADHGLVWGDCHWFLRRKL